MQLIWPPASGSSIASAGGEEAIAVNIQQIGSREILASDLEAEPTDAMRACEAYYREAKRGTLTTDSAIALSVSCSSYSLVQHHVLEEAMILAKVMAAVRLNEPDFADDSFMIFHTADRRDMIRRLATLSRKEYGTLLITADIETLEVNSLQLMVKALLRPLAATVTADKLIELVLVWYQALDFASFATEECDPLLGTKENAIRGISEYGSKYKFSIAELSDAVEISFILDQGIDSGVCNDYHSCVHGRSIASFINALRGCSKRVSRVKQMG